MGYECCKIGYELVIVEAAQLSRDLLFSLHFFMYFKFPMIKKLINIEQNIKYTITPSLHDRKKKLHSKEKKGASIVA